MNVTTEVASFHAAAVAAFSPSKSNDGISVFKLESAASEDTSDTASCSSIGACKLERSKSRTAPDDHVCALVHASLVRAAKYKTVPPKPPDSLPALRTLPLIVRVAASSAIVCSDTAPPSSRCVRSISTCPTLAPPEEGNVYLWCAARVVAVSSTRMPLSFSVTAYEPGDAASVALSNFAAY